MIKKNLTSSIILVMMLLITPCVSAQTYRQIKGWSKEVNDRLEDFLNSTITMKIRKVAVFDGDGTVMGQVPHYLADEALYQYADEHFKGKTDKFSKEKMAIWNVAHNVGGALIGPMAAVGMAWFGSWQAGTFWFPAIVALVIVVIAYLLIRDTPQSCGLPPIEQYRNDYPPNYSAQSEVELTAKEIFFKYVLSNKILWYIAIANAFIYLVRYGVLDWAPTYLKEVKGYDIKEIGWAYFSYEFAAIPGTIFCGWLSDKVFKGRRAITTMIYMAAVAIFVFVYWEFSKTPLMDSICLIAIGFLIYGPVMLIGVHALDLAPKKAAGTAAGFTGFFGYFFGTALFANIGLGYVVQNLGWNWNFIVLLVACALAFIFIGFTAKEEQYLVKQAKQ